MKLPVIAGLALFAALNGMAQAIPDFTPPTPLLAALSRNQLADVQKLLASGADPNENRLAGFTPVFFPVLFQNAEMLRAMVARGADVKAVDGAGSTTLMWAAANEAGSTVIIDELLRLGVDPNHKNKLGETALDWAQRRGHTAAMATLAKATGMRNDANQKAVERAVALMQKSGPQFVRVSGCTSCHHQSVPQMAYGYARMRGYAVNDNVSKQEMAATVQLMKAIRPLMEAKGDQIPDIPITIPYILMGMHAEGYAADELTTAAIGLLTSKQRIDGSFPSFPARPPIESSDITATALSIRVMDLYGNHKTEAEIRKATAWLMAAKVNNTEEMAMKLAGLGWGKAPMMEVQKAARMLMAAQRPEGGWGQLPTLESDAYATGQALYALYQAGMITTDDMVYKRGAGYLLRTQMADGSWHVRSRAFPLQPLKESGFPHGRDQWISASGTGWATVALSLPAAAKPTEKSTESGGND